MLSPCEDFSLYCSSGRVQLSVRAFGGKFHHFESFGPLDAADGHYYARREFDRLMALQQAIIDRENGKMPEQISTPFEFNVGRCGLNNTPIKIWETVH